MRRSAFSLVELLVVIAIVAILVALLLPAIQSARESARRANCQNNLRQVGAALLNYHGTHETFPHGGWGHQWVGTPGRGVGKHQPGGWLYSLLPFVEEQDLYDLGSGQFDASAQLSFSQRIQTPISLFVCSSRRPCRAWPVSDRYPYVRNPSPFGTVTKVARSDYAINAGSSVAITIAGPSDLRQGEDETYWATSVSERMLSGISHVRWAVSLRRIDDGASKTYLVGEKHVEAASYESGESLGDNESQYAGYCTDLNRFAGAIERLAVSQSPAAPPLHDSTSISTGLAAHSRFGSAHSVGFSMLTCDGSLQHVSYDIDPEVHLRYGHRNDGGAALEWLARIR